MSQQYLLPCPCGQTIPVEISQAGQLVTCVSCNEQIEVPTMREIRQLEPVESPADERSPTEWTTLRNLFFAGGFAITTIALIFTAICLYKYITLSRQQHINARVDSWNVFETSMYWDRSIEGPGLTFYSSEPPHIKARRESRVWGGFSILSVAVLLAGIGTLGYAFIQKPVDPNSKPIRDKPDKK